MDAMLTSHLPPRRFLWLVVALLILSVTACAGPPAGQPAAPASSVQDQLAQLAGSAEPRPSIMPGAAAASATESAQARPTKRPAAPAVASPKPTRRPSATTAVQPTRAPRATVTPSDGGLPTIAQAKLPKEARQTIRLIQQGGPFPYRQDGATFQNREGLLPKRPSGYYREYTVITPGSPDRGARRIIGGDGGELYYTDDHYDSFKRVIP